MLKGKKVIAAQVHQPVTVAGLVNSERSLNATKIPGVDMSWTLHGLLLVKGSHQALIPAANVAVIEFEK